MSEYNKTTINDVKESLKKQGYSDEHINTFILATQLDIHAKDKEDIFNSLPSQSE
jgi:hypothetical protein